MKFKNHLLFIISIIAITGCATNQAGSVVPEEKPDYLFYNVKEGVNVDELYGSPWMNTAVEGMMEKIEKPDEKDDFFAASNYEYIQTITIPEGGRRIGGLLSDADVEVAENLYSLISKETTTYLSPYIKNAATYLTNGSKEEIKSKINSINNYTTKEEIYDYLATIDSLSTVTSILTPYYYNNYIVVTPGGILSDNSLLALIYSYRSRTTTLNIISDTIKTLFMDVGYSEEEANDFTSGYTTAEANLVKNFSFSAWGGMTRLDNLDELFTNYKIEDLALNLGYSNSDTVYYLRGTQEYLSSFKNLSLEDAKKVLINRMMFDYAPIVGLDAYKAFLNSMSSFEYKSLDNASIEAALTSAFETISSKILERAYYDVYCSATTKNQVMTLIGDIIDEYKVILENNEWLSSTTKQKAIKKVDKMGYDACYPDEITNYPTFSPIKYSSALDLYSEMTLYNKDAKLKDTNWFWPCYTVNGAYDPYHNMFIIFNGILSGGVLTSESTKEEIYAQVGSIIGHEISHAFDANGSYFDENGNQINWWTSSDRQTFNKKVTKMANYINTIEIKKNLKMKGSKVNTEVTADMGGIRVMLSLAKKEQNFNYQKFFEKYSSLWAFKYTEEAVSFYNSNDEHPLGYIRVNLTLSQFDEFMETYNVKEGDGMYVAPENRIAIW